RLPLWRLPDVEPYLIAICKIGTAGDCRDRLGKKLLFDFTGCLYPVLVKCETTLCDSAPYQTQKDPHHGQADRENACKAPSAGRRTFVTPIAARIMLLATKSALNFDHINSPSWIQRLTATW